MDDDGQLPPPRDPEPLSRHVPVELEEVVKAIKASDVDELIKARMDKMLLDYKPHLQAVAVGVVRLQSRRILKLIEYVSDLEDDLAREVKTQNLDFETKMELLKIYRKSLDSELKFLMEMAIGTKIVVLQDNRRVQTGGISVEINDRAATVEGGVIMPEGRERLRMLMDGFTKRLTNGSGEGTPPPAPDA